jgi:hypothetical protein
MNGPTLYKDLSLWEAKLYIILSLIVMRKWISQQFRIKDKASDVRHDEKSTFTIMSVYLHNYCYFICIAHLVLKEDIFFFTFVYCRRCIIWLPTDLNPYKALDHSLVQNLIS